MPSLNKGARRNKTSLAERQKRRVGPDISKAFLRLSPSSMREMSIPESGILPCGDTQFMPAQFDPTGAAAAHPTILQAHLVDESTHPGAGRQQQQSVREEDEVALDELLRNNSE